VTTRHGALAALLAVLLVSRTSSAAPAEDEAPKDFDLEKEEFSEFWERALEPNRKPYAQLIAQARALSFENDAPALDQAERLLGDAIRLAPDQGDAYWELGLLHKRRNQWHKCSEVLGAIFAFEPSYVPKGGTDWSFDLELGTCLAHAGSYRPAIRHFQRILARGQDKATVHRRIGESLMALGELAQAIEFFETAGRVDDPLEASYALAVAYDRDERNALARTHLDEALRKDPNLTRLASRTDFIPAVDRYYYLGLAHVSKDRAWALVYFRHYLHEAPQQPWRARATRHLGELRTTLERELPVNVLGATTEDADAARVAVRSQQKELARCVADTPGLLLRVKLKQLAGRRGPHRPAAGITVLVDYAFGVDTPKVEEVVRCIDRAASELDLPSFAGPQDAYTVVEFPVLALRP